MSKVIILFILLYCSINAQWIIQEVPGTNGLADIYFADTSEGWVTAFDDGIFYTSDGGYTWQQQYASFAANLSGLSNTELWLVGERDTLLHTTDGGIDWEKISLQIFLDLDSVAGLTGIDFYNSLEGWIYVLGWESGIYAGRLLKTTDSGIHWQIKPDPIRSSLALIQFLDSSNGFIAGNEPVPLCKTTNGGESWDTLAYLGFWNGLMDMQFINQDIGWATADGPVLTTLVWKTIDGGFNWVVNLTFQCSNLSTYIYFTDTLNGWVVQWTCLSASAEISHTTNGGLSWDLQYTYSPFSPKKIYFVDSLHGWIISDYYDTILHTSTGGIIPVELSSFTAKFIDNAVNLKWTTKTETNNKGFETQRSVVSDKLLEPLSEKSEWEKIGYVDGYGTTTKPNSYTFEDRNVNDGTYKYRIKQIDFDGNYKYSNEKEVEVNFTPNEYILYQNYPNPFNSSTSIKYYVPEKSNIRLTIYNILGSEIKVLVNEPKEAGNYKINFDADKYPSGLYMCRLETVNITKPQFMTKKMMLIK